VPLTWDFTDATIVSLSAQVTAILAFFLARNLRIARERAWDQTVASRGKGPEFWQPYVEEWAVPPQVDEKMWAGMEGVRGWVATFAVKKSTFQCSCISVSITDQVPSKSFSSRSTQFPFLASLCRRGSGPMTRRAIFIDR